MTQVTCPKCGHKFEAQRVNERGKGAHYSKQQTKLSRMQREILGVLDSAGAIDYDHGISMADITLKLNTLRRASERKNVKDQTVSARLSELQGLGVLSCVPADVFLGDRDTMRFTNAGTPKWYRVGRSILET